jgi:hypothetical protein
MSDFVEQCRREWSRLGVADPLADEMAADLASDLAEAEAEGVSAEELLGSSVFAPRSFAAAWAVERGIVPERPGRASARRPRVLVAFTALAALTVLVSALMLATGEPRLSLVTTRRTPPPLLVPRAGVVPTHVSGRSVLTASAAAPVEWILLFLAVVALGFAAWLWASWSRPRPPTAPA